MTMALAHTRNELKSLAESAARAIVAYGFRRWGFGEKIALRALLEASDVLQRLDLRRHVEDLVGNWARTHESYVPADHVAPGLVLLDLYQSSGDATFLEAATRLGALYETFPAQHGIPVHRPDIVEHSSSIWVDCLAIDAPFLFQLARVTDEPAFARLGRWHLHSYIGALKDPASGFYTHGYDLTTRSPSAVHWGRGNAWALTGLAFALEHAPEEDTELRAFLKAETLSLADSMAARQDSTGGWHTIVDDPSSPIEPSVAAFYAAVLRRAHSLRLLAPTAAMKAATESATKAVLDQMSPDGLLPVSSATPIGDRATYVDRPSGVFPWGQGPALLALCEAIRVGGR